ncbi:hypothetical protein FRC07_000476 [Ceratobasidium sp. 392]|nr:hypothetical protein FRC07_000476 [Ceratobasidium sp. 392]
MDTDDQQPHWIIYPAQITIAEGRPLGTGGFGTVYRGVWEGANVAVKRLAEETSEQIFMKQVKLWLGLRHPHVLQLFGASSVDSRPLYFVTQLFQHGNINQYIAKTEAPGRERGRLLHEIALGMQYLHGRKIIHGDLKPANVLVSDSLRACIADFGLSEMKLDFNERSSIGGGRREIAGSPRYFSPEAWKGQTSFSSDVFAFAMTAFEVFSSTPPWGILSSTHIYQLVVRENERPDRPEGDYPIDSQWSLIEKAWQREGRARPTFEYITRNWSLDDIGSSQPPTAGAVELNNLETSVSNSTTDFGRNADRQSIVSMGLPSPLSPVSRLFSMSPAPAYEQEPTLIHAITPPRTGYNTDPTIQPKIPPPGGHTESPSPPSSSRASVIRSLPSPPPASMAERFSRMSVMSHGSEGSWNSAPQTPFQTSPTIFQPSPTSYAQRMPGIMTIHEDGSVTSSSTQGRSATLPNMRGTMSSVSSVGEVTPTNRRWTDTQETLGQSDPVAQRRVSAVLLAGALQSETVESRQQSAIDEHLIDVQKLAASSEKEAQKLVTAGIINTLTILLRERAIDSVGLDLVLKALGTLAHDTLTANTLNRTGSTEILIELFKTTTDENIALLSLWCIGRLARSSDIATSLIKLDLLPALFTFGFTHPKPNPRPLRARLAAWCVGNLARNDLLASTVIDRPVVSQSLATELQHMNANSAPIDVSAVLYAVARLSRTIRNSKILSRAGCVSLVVSILLSANSANVLCWSARAVGCLMRPNSGDMSRALLDAGAARGLARLPRICPDAMPSLEAFAFAIQRFSCAEWGSGTRKALVEAGVVDSLLAALRTASEVRSSQTHVELALAVSFLGDVGGGPIRKEIMSASGIEILKRVAAEGNAEVAKACGLAITSITGNVFTRNAASAKTAMAHNWNGGCPDFELRPMEIFSV